jgi:hypothetical protein
VSAQIVTDGQDPLTKPALDLLVSWGVPAPMIRRIVVDSKVGDAQVLQVTLFVPIADPAATAVLPRATLERPWQP